MRMDGRGAGTFYCVCVAKRAQRAPTKRGKRKQVVDSLSPVTEKENTREAAAESRERGRGADRQRQRQQ
jgi:hypothetical protein